MSTASRPIGVFDSGVGGLSVLRALRAELPHERFVYVADSGNAPYGERDDDHVTTRSHAIADYLLAQHQIKALVVACNTATAAAIKTLRAAYPSIPLVGIEPALKPAAAASQTKTVGVMATRGTLQSEKFQALLASLHGQATFVLQPCDGLAIAIERNDATKTEALCAEYTRAMGLFGLNPDAMDTLVLGCTHYPFVEAVLRRSIGNQVALLEGGAPVARHTRRLLDAAGLLAAATTEPVAPTQFLTTGEIEDLRSAAARWLQLDTSVGALAI
ncbi:glutamate racemase [Rhodoferax saidenbachensis]|uniref:Glutamate racemase n=1 Tax=Rhodoferax saidenbachensis TaxID=1484693 RepID=A0ABU1ZVD0_9BURK|nr:glutamate racemase [Rhodoferax saidenbachensis]MDR7308506.1 glutamate racemase [Rhodoferax saidenbachensis]